MQNFPFPLHKIQFQFLWEWVKILGDRLHQYSSIKTHTWINNSSQLYFSLMAPKVHAAVIFEINYFFLHFNCMHSQVKWKYCANMEYFIKFFILLFSFFPLIHSINSHQRRKQSSKVRIKGPLNSTIIVRPKRSWKYICRLTNVINYNFK